MRLLVCGSRDWFDKQAVMAVLKAYPPDTIIIHGGCRGADMAADYCARLLRLPVLTFPADWTQGPGAGPRRNQRMLEAGSPDAAVVFHHDWECSRGTADMVRRLQKAGVPFTVYGQEASL